METGVIREAKTFSRICTGGCGMRLKVGGEGQIVDIRADVDHPMTKGYACFKGLQAEEAHHGPARLLKPLKRQPDGSFEEIGLEQALDEIAEKLRPYYDSGDKDAIGLFNGNGVSLQMPAASRPSLISTRMSGPALSRSPMAGAGSLSNQATTGTARQMSIC